MSFYQLTQKAQDDLTEILEFIGNHKQNPQGAKIVLDYLHASMLAVGKILLWVIIGRI